MLVTFKIQICIVSSNIWLYEHLSIDKKLFHYMSIINLLDCCHGYNQIRSIITLITQTLNNQTYKLIF